MDWEEKIHILRTEIDALDREILRLLNLRAQRAIEVGKIKKAIGAEAYHPHREEEIIGNLSRENFGPFPCKAIAPVFREIISACRSLERELTVAYLGPAATYTHQACMDRFGSSVQVRPEESIQEVFEAVERGKADYGVVPIENSTEGVVNRTLDMFIESEVRICGEILMRISHDLLSANGNPGAIEKIYSHPQALAQCRRWLAKHYPKAQVIETLSTARAAQLAATDPQAGAIASSFAARI